MLSVNRWSILEKHYVQTFKTFLRHCKRFDNVSKTLPNKCYYTLFIRPLKNVIKMLCVCWCILSSVNMSPVTWTHEYSYHPWRVSRLFMSLVTCTYDYSCHPWRVLMNILSSVMWTHVTRDVCSCHPWHTNEYSCHSWRTHEYSCHPWRTHEYSCHP